MNPNLPALLSSIRQSLLLISLCAILLAPPKALAAAEGLADRSKAAATDVKEAVTDAGRAVANKAEDLWKRLDDARLKNRTPDQIVAWVIMGVLVGALAGLFTSPGTTGFGKLGRLLLGLAGAFLGGVAGQFLHIDLGMGPVLIRYEELLFAFGGAVLLVGVSRIIRSRAKKKS
ncbi:MAG TPA: hypothetical protein VNU68_15615 [Verrucomicrobiae bacterium]|nr:hypothetical protein [Verrucomicrobiae bacterium]